MQPNDMASADRACKDGKYSDAILWPPRRAPQITVLSACFATMANRQHSQAKNRRFYIVLAHHGSTADKYKYDTSVLCLYCLFIAMIDRLPLCHAKPLRCRCSIFVKKIFSENFSLRIKSFSENFFLIFFIFIFHSSRTREKCRYCPFICPTIARNAFYVQLFVRSNFNRLQRKYDCLCVLQEMEFIFICFGRKLKT